MLTMIWKLFAAECRVRVDPKMPSPDPEWVRLTLEQKMVEDSLKSGFHKKLHISDFRPKL